MYGNYGAHPMAFKQMGGFLDDLWDDVTDKAKEQAQTIIKQAPAQIANAAAGAITSNAQVQQVAQQTATQAAINKTAEELNALKAKLSAELSAISANPTGWIKANPGKVAIFVGVLAVSVGGVYFLIKGMRK